MRLITKIRGCGHVCQKCIGIGCKPCMQIVAFAKKQTDIGAAVTLDIWDDMSHDFQAYDSLMASSTEALNQIAVRFHAAIGNGD